MAQPKRTDPQYLPPSPPPAAATPAPWGLPGDGRAAPAGDYAVGGQVGQMHAELAERLARAAAMPGAAPDAPAERVIRVLSMTGGFAALAAAYAGIAFLLLR